MRSVSSNPYCTVACVFPRRQQERNILKYLFLEQAGCCSIFDVIQKWLIDPTPRVQGGQGLH